MTHIHSEAFMCVFVFVCVCVPCKQSKKSHNLLLQRLLVDWVEMPEPFVFSFIEVRKYARIHSCIGCARKIVNSATSHNIHSCVLTVCTTTGASFRNLFSLAHMHGWNVPNYIFFEFFLIQIWKSYKFQKKSDFLPNLWKKIWIAICNLSKN